MTWAEQDLDKWLDSQDDSKLPVCERCDEPIYDEYYDFGDGKYCEDCFQEWAREHRHDVGEEDD